MASALVEKNSFTVVSLYLYRPESPFLSVLSLWVALFGFVGVVVCLFVCLFVCVLLFNEILEIHNLVQDDLCTMHA